MSNISKHIPVTKIELIYPFIIGYLTDGPIMRIDIREIVSDFEKYPHAYNHMKQLLDKEFFSCGKLASNYSINWHERSSFVDLDTFVFIDGEEIKL